MLPQLTLFFGLLAVTAFAALGARRWHIPISIFLVLLGLAIGFLPGMPRIELGDNSRVSPLPFLERKSGQKNQPVTRGGWCQPGANSHGLHSDSCKNRHVRVAPARLAATVAFGAGSDPRALELDGRERWRAASVVVCALARSSCEAAVHGLPRSSGH